jgi:hypothetical protein
MLKLCSRRRQMVRRAAFVISALLATVGYVPAAWAQNQIFVTNYSGDKITVYPRSASGDIAPSFTILGQLGDGPHQIAINHRGGELIVTNNVANSVAVYDWSSGALKRKISGPSTQLIRPTGVAVDEVNGEIYVANDYGSSITVYDVLATGDSPPKRNIQSLYLSGPVGVAIDLTHDEIVVTTQGYHSIATFERSANGFSWPKRIISGFATGLNLPQGVALDLANDEILVANSAYQTPNGGAILVFRRTDGDVYGGTVAPIRRIEGSLTKLCNPMSVAVDRAANELVVANSNFGAGSCAQSVTTYSRTANGNAAPKRTIAGALSALVYPASAAITSASDVNVKTSALSPNVAAGATIGYSIKATATGGPVFKVTLTDNLPGGLTWLLGGTNASSCALSPPPESKLTCAFGDLLKGATRDIQVSAISTTSSCPKVLNQATASFNDGTADVSSVSPLASITVKCR